MLPLTFAALAAVAPPLPQTAPPPARVPAAPSAMPIVVSYGTAAVRCGGVEQRATLPVRSYETLSWGSRGVEPALARFTFRIDGAGRPLDIAAMGEAAGFPYEVPDLAPALAASRFAAGEPRGDCVAVYTPSAAPLALAPREQLYRYYGMPHRTGPFDRQLFNALKPAGSDCHNPNRAPRTLNFPDTAAIPQPPGTASYAVLGYDLDARGRPVRLHILSSDGNAALNRAASAAVASSRFEPGARTGCIARFGRRQDRPTEAPPIPEVVAFRPADAQCDKEPPWAEMPRLIFPEAYNRRAIEGWAIVGYDVAPWGQTGNIRVLASEPSEDFGKAAMPIIAGARQPATPRGFSGCVARVRFVLPPPGQPVSDEDVEEQTVND